MKSMQCASFRSARGKPVCSLYIVLAVPTEGSLGGVPTFYVKPFLLDDQRHLELSKFISRVQAPI